MEQALTALLEQAARPARLSPGDLPDLDLYMDQIVTLLEARATCAPGEKPLTKTMINNYSKEGLIKPVKGKKYTREHVLQMLVIHTLKPTLSIGEIKGALQSVYATPGFDGAALAQRYQAALDCCEGTRDEVERLMQALLERCGAADQAPPPPEALLEAVLSLSQLSQVFAAAARGLCAEYLSAPQKEH